MHESSRSFLLSGCLGWAPLWVVLALGLSSHALAAAPDASELLPAEHWSIRVVERFDELGLLEAHLPAQNLLTRAQVRTALLEGSQRATEMAPELARLAAAYLAQFDDEFRAYPIGDSTHLTLHGPSASVGPQLAATRSMAVDPAVLTTRHVPFPEDTRTGLLTARASATLTRHVAVSVQPGLSSSGPELRSWEAVLSWGGVEVSAGRTPVAYGLRGGRGAIMSGQQSFDRLELRTSAPFVLPGFLRHLGSWAVDVFATPVRESRHPGNPVLWGMSIRVEPHPRLTIGVQRGVMFGGGARPDHRGRDVLRMLLASSNQQENNLGSADFLLRLPTEAVVPLTLYGEWAADDLGAQFKAPGIMAGIRTPAVPGLPNVSVGGEFAFFGVLCCRVHTWYSHSNHVGGWVLDEAPLGHPMGGDGREFRVYGSASMLDARLGVDLRALTRERFDTNLFAPFRPGRSLGVASTIRWRVLKKGEFGASWEQEWGRGWRTGTVAAQISAFF